MNRLLFVLVLIAISAIAFVLPAANAGIFSRGEVSSHASVDASAPATPCCDAAACSLLNRTRCDCRGGCCPKVDITLGTPSGPQAVASVEEPAPKPFPYHLLAAALLGTLIVSAGVVFAVRVRTASR